MSNRDKSVSRRLGTLGPLREVSHVHGTGFVTVRVQTQDTTICNGGCTLNSRHPAAKVPMSRSHPQKN